MMLPSIVFLGVFASQIYVLSVHLPRKLTTGLSDESPEWRQALQTSRLYATANIVLAVAGASLLLAFFFVDALATMTPALLTVGGFFFLQMTPLAIVVAPVLARSPAIELEPNVLSGPVRLADFVSPWIVAMAVVLVIGYMGAQLAMWDGTWSKQVLKNCIFAAVQLFIGGTLLWTLSATRRAGTADRAERIQGLVSMAPMFMLLSIGISAYYFGKDLLFVLELQALRPAMMSFFLQMLALLAIHYVLRPWPNKPLRPTAAAGG